MQGSQLVAKRLGTATAAQVAAATAEAASVAGKQPTTYSRAGGGVGHVAMAVPIKRRN